MPRHSFRSAFSLLEVIITISLVIVVMVVGWGASSRIRHTAKGAACVRQLQALWVEWNHYNHETKGNLYSGTSSWMPVVHAKGALDDTSLLTCPATNALAKDVYKEIFYHRVEQKWVSRPNSYTANFYALYVTAEARSTWEFTRRHATPLFMDGKVYAVTPAGWADESIWSLRLAFRHNDRSNFLFVDGHAEALTRRDIREINPLPK